MIIRRIGMLSPSRRRLLVVVCLGLLAGVPAGRADEPAKPKLEFRRAERSPAAGLIEAAVPGQTEKIYLHKDAELTEADLAAASVGKDESSNPCINIVFTKAGSDKMAKLSEAIIDKPLAILIDGKVISAPTVRSKFSGRAQIAGPFSKAEVEAIVKKIAPK
jgi:preprotein translocase subunit SecD